MAVSAVLSVGLAGGGLGFTYAETKPQIPHSQVFSPHVAPDNDNTPDIIDLPVEEKKMDISGLEVNILSDIDASDSFDAEETTGTKLSLAVKKRNEMLFEDTGAITTVTAASDFYQTATSDILTGTNKYNLYAGDVLESLYPLFSQGYLHDITDSAIIDTDNEWYDGTVMDRLSFYNGQYFISSYATAPLQNMNVLVYNRDTMSDIDKAILNVAFDGKFTVDKLVSYCEAWHREIGFNECQYGVSYSDEDIMPLYFGLGGRVVGTTDEDVTAYPLSQMRERLLKVSSLLESELSFYSPSGTADELSLFSVKKLSEVPYIRQHRNIGILPLPKMNTKDHYTSYLDLDGACMLAIPKNAADTEKLEYFVDRLAYFSHELLKPYYVSLVTDGDEELINLILGSAVSDLDALFGYGEIEALFAETVHSGDGQLTLSYYERKALYEKALSIVAKRIEK